ncbi:hypothetical protein CYMTET_22220, partial [Cymbomonas tetramitiformis]
WVKHLQDATFRDAEDKRAQLAFAESLLNRRLCHEMTDECIVCLRAIMWALAHCAFHFGRHQPRRCHVGFRGYLPSALGSEGPDCDDVELLAFLGAITPPLAQLPFGYGVRKIPIGMFHEIFSFASCLPAGPEAVDKALRSFTGRIPKDYLEKRCSQCGAAHVHECCSICMLQFTQVEQVAMNMYTVQEKVSVNLDVIGEGEGDCILRLDCGHLFHRECADSWLHQSPKCPNCRQLISDESSASPPPVQRPDDDEMSL